MIQFMVLAAPRSGTAWAANWLTTDHSLCLHDPLWRRHYLELDAIESKKTVGVACTGLPLFGKWVNQHPARKVILHRNIDEVSASLRQIGMPPIGDEFEDQLRAIAGRHYWWRDIFERPKAIYEYLLERPFDAERHAMLKDLEVQLDFEGVVVNREATARLLAELQAAAHMGRMQ